MESIDSTAVDSLSDSSSQSLLEEIQLRQGLQRLAPWVLVLATSLLVALWSLKLTGIPMAVTLCASALAYWWASARDVIRRIVVVTYDLEGEAADCFEQLLDAMKSLGDVGGLWHVDAQGEVRDRKYHAGAASMINRKSTRPGVGQPSLLRTNLDVPSLSVGKQQLYFFPDRLLVLEGSQVGAVGYQSVHIDIGTTRFIEDEGVPNDAQIVDRTWRYVNKKGGPDRRFSDNRELPIVLYETIHFRSTTGLNELLHASRVGMGGPLAQAVARMAVLSRPSMERSTGTERPETASTAVTSTSVMSDVPLTNHYTGRPNDNVTRSEESFDRLRRGHTAAVISERAPGWEYKTFALALIDTMNEPPTVAVPPMPTDLTTKSQVAEWATEQLNFLHTFSAAVERLMNTELQTAFGPAGKPGDPDAILRVAWEIGRQTAAARAWATAVWTTQLPKNFVPLREEIARTLDQPLKAVSDYGAMLLATIEESLAAPKGRPRRTINITLSMTTANQDALSRAIESAFR